MWVGPLDGMDDDAATPVIGTILMVAVVVVIATVLTVGALTFLPDEEPSPRPEASFQFDRSASGVLAVTPTYMEDDTRFDLLVDGQRVYSWRGDGLSEQRRLRCLFPGNELTIRSRAQSGRSYLIASHEVETATACSLPGTSVPFASVIVEDRAVSLFDPSYEFSLYIDPQGEGTADGEGPISVTNGWHYVQRYDRSLEGLDGPTWVIVLADNADYDAEAPPDAGADAYEIQGDQVVPTAGGSEPTNDIYLVFSPGCDQSTLKLVEVQASYDNSVLLGETVVIEDTSTATETTYDAPGVTCPGG
mgnify:FL=1